MLKIAFTALVSSLVTASGLVLFQLVQDPVSEEFDPDHPLLPNPIFGKTSGMTLWLHESLQPNYRIQDNQFRDVGGFYINDMPLLYFFLYQTKIGSSSHVLVLLERGADPNLGYKGVQPLELAIERKNFLNVVMLVEFGASLENKEKISELLNASPKEDELNERIRSYLDYRFDNPPPRPLNSGDLWVGVP